MQKAKFGTDGIRGQANMELTAEISLLVGKSAAYHLCNSKTKKRGRVLIGKDTRLSGDMIEAAIIAGVCSTGAEAWRIGIAPTPCLAYMTNALNCDCGIMISASHNPVEDNGIKIFSSSGYKLEDADEKAIEVIMNNGANCIHCVPGDRVGCSVDKTKETSAYVSFIKRFLRGVFFESPIVIDCANGAGSRIAKRIFADVADEVIFINSDEDGRKINVNCGSTKPAILREKVLRHKAVLGVAFDGDADRAIFIDEKGQIIDGDQIMLLCARHMKKENKLSGDTVVATVMSNMGFEKALAEFDTKMIRAQVGDKYVLRDMQAGGYVLGGEQSGHIIFLNHATTGDGLLTAAQAMRVTALEGHPFSELTAMKRSAQFLKNVRVPDKESFYASQEIQDKVADVEKRLGDQGRVVVRPSGTEPLIRVMVETWDESVAESSTDEIISEVKRVFNIE